MRQKVCLEDFHISVTAFSPGFKTSPTDTWQSNTWLLFYSSFLLFFLLNFRPGKSADCNIYFQAFSFLLQMFISVQFSTVRRASWYFVQTEIMGQCRKWNTKCFYQHNFPVFFIPFFKDPSTDDMIVFHSSSRVSKQIQMRDHFLPHKTSSFLLIF